ncbi:MAG: thiamine diphosphokinase [Deltaproteobacteria bacterium]|jgi:thiamine pyrophosphokinase|nr:thiamine diphosphokinase [Deltaproteobacteria bacterium]
MFPTVYIFLNGNLSLPQDFPKEPGEGNLVIAADGGLVHTHSIGWVPDIILGDLDSAPLELVERYKDSSIAILTYPKAKDKTDFQLAMELALECLTPFGLIDVLAAFGGRWDMTFSNLFVPVADNLSSTRAKSPLIQFSEGETTIYLMIGPQSLKISPKSANYVVSLMPISPKAEGISLLGDFQYPLKDSTLLLGQTLGISNQLKGDSGTVILKKGLMAVFLHP